MCGRVVPEGSDLGLEGQNETCVSRPDFVDSRCSGQLKAGSGWCCVLDGGGGASTTSAMNNKRRPIGGGEERQTGRQKDRRARPSSKSLGTDQLRFLFPADL